MTADPLPAVRAAYGVALLVVPLSAPGPRRYCRLLGLRQAVEGVVLMRGGPAVAAAGAAIDALHAVSALWLATRSPRHHRVLRANAAAATVLAALGVRRARALRRPR
jgi:hypothetical protein